MSQLDPFFMLDAPDLSAGGPSQGYEVGPNQRIEVEEEAESGYQLIHQAPPASSSPPEPTYAPPSPQPTYGAFPLYSGPAEAPQIVTASPTTTTKPPVTKKPLFALASLLISLHSGASRRLQPSDSSTKKATSSRAQSWKLGRL